MKNILLLIFIFFLNPLIYAQVKDNETPKTPSKSKKKKDPIASTAVGVKVTKEPRLVLERGEIKVNGSFTLLAQELENQAIRASISFSPSKETFNKLEKVNFEKLIIDLIIHPEGRRERIKYHREKLILKRQDIVKKRTLYVSKELFSFSDYNWAWENVPLGTSSKKIRFLIDGIKINTTEKDTIPLFYEGVKLEFKIEDSKSKFKELSTELLKRGIYPNKEAFDILFSSNNKFFYENRNNINNKKLFELDFPLKPDSTSHNDFPPTNSFFDMEDARRLKLRINSVRKNEDLKDLLKNKDRKDIENQLEMISEFFNKVSKNQTKIDTQTQILLINHTNFFIDVLKKEIRRIRNSKAKIEEGLLFDLKIVLRDLTNIINLIQVPNSSSNLLEFKPNEIGRLVSYDFKNENTLSSEHLVDLIVHTSNDKPLEDYLVDGYIVKGTPWSSRNKDLQEIKERKELFVSSESNPAIIKDIPVATYFFWVEKDGKPIPLDYTNDLQIIEGEGVKQEVYSYYGKAISRILYLFNYKEPVHIYLNLKK